MSKMVNAVCLWRGCRSPFKVRAVDRARGWGRFCSKSCKARHQTVRTERDYPPMGRGGYDWTEGGAR